MSELFGNCPRVKILEAFADNPDEELSVPFIEEVTGVAKSTLYAYIRRLEEEGIIEFTDIIRHRSKDTRLYKLNPNDDRAKFIIMMESFFVSKFMSKLIEDRGEKTIFEEIENVVFKLKMKTEVKELEESGDIAGWDVSLHSGPNVGDTFTPTYELWR